MGARRSALSNGGSTGHAMLNSFQRHMLQVSGERKRGTQKSRALLKSQKRYNYKKPGLPRLPESLLSI